MPLYTSLVGVLGCNPRNDFIIVVCFVCILFIYICVQLSSIFVFRIYKGIERFLGKLYVILYKYGEVFPSDGQLNDWYIHSNALFHAYILPDIYMH